MRGSTELLTYDIATQHDATTRTGKVHVTVRELLTGHGTYSAVNGVGDATLLIDIPRIQRKLKVDTKFKVAAPQYDFRNEFYYDYERANDKKIIFDTKTTWNGATAATAQTKNQLEIGTEIYQLNGEHSTVGTVDAATQRLRVAIVLPTQRRFEWEWDRTHNYKDTTQASGSCHSRLVDTQSDGRIRSLAIDSQLTDGNYQAKLFRLATKVEFVDFDGSNAAIDVTFKNLPNGQYKMGAAQLTARGSLLAEVVDIEISADEYCPMHAVYRVTGKYGGKFNMNVSGNYHIGGRAKPNTYDFTATVNIPETDMKTIRFESKAKYLMPQTTDGQYEGEFRVLASLNDRTVNVDTTAKGNGRTGSGSVAISLPDVDSFKADASYTLSGKDGVDDDDDDNSSKSNDSSDETDAAAATKASATLTVHYGQGKTIKANGEVKRRAGKEVTVHGTLTTPFETGKTIEFTYKGLVSIYMRVVLCGSRTEA